MTNWLRVLHHLLPRGRAWKLWPGTRIRQFFEGLTSGLMAPFRDEVDRTFLDLFPQTTRHLDDWEAQWALPGEGLSEQERRDRLEAQWRALGGQSPHYLQETLRGAGFDVYVHEWWQPGTNPPQPRDPFAVIGAPNPGYLLVSGVGEVVRRFTTLAGQPVMRAGRPEAVAGRFDGQTLQPKPYPTPESVDQWRYILYIGGETYPNPAQIPAFRRAEFETLVLQIRPSQQWVGALVEFF